MHDAATVGHLILVRVLGVVVVVHRMNDAQIEEQAILKSNQFELSQDCGEKSLKTAFTPTSFKYLLKFLWNKKSK